jgi:hypothetical protein
LNNSPGKNSAGAYVKSKRSWENSVPHSGRTGSQKTASLNAKNNSSSTSVYRRKRKEKEKE